MKDFLRALARLTKDGVLHPLQQVVARRDGADNLIRVNGHLTVVRIEPDTRRETVLVEDHNLVVNNGYTMLANVWGGPSAPNTRNDLAPGHIAIGTDATAEAVSQTALGSEQYRQAVDTVSFFGSPVNGVQFEMVIGTANANGVTYYEAGLMTTDTTANTGLPELIARKTFAALTKDNTFELGFRWRFTFTPA